MTPAPAALRALRARGAVVPYLEVYRRLLEDGEATARPEPLASAAPVPRSWAISVQLAILDRALCDRDRGWFESEDEGFGSFLDVCEWLRLDPRRVRETALRRIDLAKPGFDLFGRGRTHVGKQRPGNVEARAA